MLNTEEILSYINQHIPITTDLKVEIKSYTGTSCVLTAPLDKNINHSLTAFGGSLSAVGILSGWTLVFMKLKELGIENNLVIQNSSFNFLKPVKADFEAHAKLPSPEEMAYFKRLFERKGVGRVVVKSEILCGGELCGIHLGEYVASAM